jgi:hypothetical protein
LIKKIRPSSSLPIRTVSPFASVASTATFSTPAPRPPRLLLLIRRAVALLLLLLCALAPRAPDTAPGVAPTPRARPTAPTAASAPVPRARPLLLLRYPPRLMMPTGAANTRRSTGPWRGSPLALPLLRLRCVAPAP